MVAGDQARAFLVERGVWREAKPGSFRARCLGPSAVVDAMDTAEDSDGPWFETWVLAVTVRDRRELLVRWLRMVNNVRMPLTHVNSKFSFEGVGILRSVPTPEGCTARTVDDSMTIAAFLEGSCACGDAGACATLADFLQREGGDASVARAGRLRQKACDLGYRPSCADAK